MAMTAERIRAARLAKGWSQIEAGNRSGLHPGTVSALERGAPVAAETVARLEAALAAAPNSGERSFLGRPLQNASGAYGEALAKAIGTRALGAAEDAEFVEDLDALRKDLRHLDEIQKANDPAARAVKVVIADNARAELATAEIVAQRAVDDARGYDLAGRLASTYIPADRAQVIATFEGLCRTARVRCLAAAALCLQLIATVQDDVERRAFEAKSTAWLDQATHIARDLGARE